MASPIAHSFAGFWTFLVFAKQLQIRLAAQWRQYLPRLGVLPLHGPDAGVDQHRRWHSPALAVAQKFQLALGIDSRCPSRNSSRDFSMDNAWSSIYELLIFGAITVIVFVYGNEN